MSLITTLLEVVVAIGLLFFAYRFVKSDMEKKTGRNNRLQGRSEL